MRKRLHDWDGLIAELEASGLSRAEFCRQRKLKYQTMSKWILRQSRTGGKVGRGRSASGLTNGLSRFAEMSVQLGAAAQAYEIVLGTGRSIRVPSVFDADTVARLIQIVESC